MLQLWRDLGRDTRWVLWSYFLWGVGEGLWIYMQPLYVRSLGASPAQTGLVLGMWGVGRLLFILPAGILADRYDARRLLIPGWYIGALGVLIIALAPGWQWAALGFLIYGISAAAIPITNLYLAQSAQHDPTRNPDLPLQRALTLLWAAYSLGLLVSPSIGGLISDAWGLRSVFLISLFWFTVSMWTILQTHSYPSPKRPALGYDYRGLLRQRSVVTAFGVTTLAFIVIYTGQTLAPQYLEEIHDYSRTWIGVLGSLNALGTAVLSLMLGRLSSWRGFFASLCLVMLAFALLLWSGLWPVVVIGYFILGAYNAARPFAVSLISERVSEHQRGMAYALVDTLAGLAAVIGMNLAGRLYAVTPEWPFGVGIAGLIVVWGLGLALAHRPVQRNLAKQSTYGEVEPAGK